MTGNGLSELNGGVVAGEDDAIVGYHGLSVAPSYFGGQSRRADAFDFF